MERRRIREMDRGKRERGETERQKEGSSSFFLGGIETEREREKERGKK